MRTFLAILMLLLLATYSNLVAQSSFLISEDDLLTYMKWIDGKKAYIVWNDSQMSVYQLASGECTDLSPDGRYLLQSSENAEMLKVFYFPTMKIVYEQAWNSAWETCYFGWFEENVISFYETNVSSVNFKFEDLSLTEILLSPPPQPIYPSLPSFYPESKNNFILQNPANPNIYLYERCFGDRVDINGFCEYAEDDSSYPQLVIYDISTSTDLEILDVWSGDFMRGYETLNNYSRDISSQLVSWSPDGRYLAYYDVSSNIEGNLKIYDLQTDTYFNDVEGLYTININRNFTNLWLNNATFVIWHTDRFWESTRLDGDEVLFAFAHADMKTYISTEQPFKVIATYYAPDGNGMLFIGKPVDPRDGVFLEDNPKRGDLFYMSSTTGEYTMIDQDVVSIITWRSICDFTVSDTASLISTMQTEPYSVICLDENGQYNLTAPLPDVAGDITIIGNGSTITMTGQNRILNVVYNQQWSRNGSLTLKNVTLSGGVADDGGAIYNAGDLTLDDVTLENNSAQNGGAIYNAGNLTMTNGALLNNTATLLGGAIYNAGPRMDLDGVRIEDNNAPEGSGVYQAP